jgi:hypothetical protein
MKLQLLLADCEVASVVASRDGIRIRLSAAHVQRIDDGDDHKPLPGFARSVLIELPGGVLHGAAAHCIGRLAHGRVHTHAGWSGSMPLPGSAAGPVKIELAFANQSRLETTANGIVCDFDGEPNFAESLFC